MKATNAEVSKASSSSFSLFQCFFPFFSVSLNIFKLFLLQFFSQESSVDFSLYVDGQKKENEQQMMQGTAERKSDDKAAEQ